MKQIQSTRFLMVDTGEYCIEVNNKRSGWAAYDSVAVLEYDGRIFVGFSWYWESDNGFKCETVHELTKIDSTVRVAGGEAQELFESDLQKSLEEMKCEEPEIDDEPHGATGPFRTEEEHDLLLGDGDTRTEPEEDPNEGKVGDYWNHGG